MEKQLGAKQEIDDRAAKIIELLRQYEELVEALKRQPGGFSELEFVEEAVRRMVEEGLLEDPPPLNTEPNKKEEGENQNGRSG